jgi:hypothetical protein
MLDSGPFMSQEWICNLCHLSPHFHLKARALSVSEKPDLNPERMKLCKPVRKIARIFNKSFHLGRKFRAQVWNFYMHGSIKVHTQACEKPTSCNWQQVGTVVPLMEGWSCIYSANHLFIFRYLGKNKGTLS